MATKKEIQQKYRWLLQNEADRFHSDSFMRQTYYEFLFWLKENGWWHYRILKRKLKEIDSQHDEKKWLKSLRKQFCRYRQDFGYDCKACYKAIGYCRYFSNGERVYTPKSPQVIRDSHGGFKGVSPPPHYDKNSVTATEEVKTIAEWKNDGEPKTYDLGWGKFIEITKRTNGKNKGVAIARGTFGLDKNGNKDPNQKQYKSNVFLTANNGSIEWLIQELTTIVKEWNNQQ
jgi:hypothetical protein